jgi:PAS domain S-box-containing protein
VSFASLSIAAITGIAVAEMTGSLVTPYSAGVSWSGTLLVDTLLAVMAALLYVTIDHLTCSLDQTRCSARDLQAAQADLRQERDTAQMYEERYRTLIQNQGEGIGIVDPHERFTFANPAAESIFGVPPGELVGRNLGEFVAPEEFARVRQQTQARQRSEKSAYEIEIVQPPGARRTLLVTATPRFDAAGRFAETFGIFRDITERKQAELALRASEEKWQRFSQHATAGIVVCDEQGNVIEWNPAQERITGIAREHALGQALVKLQFEIALPERRRPEGYAMIQASLSEFLRTGQAPWADTLTYNEIQTAAGQRRIIQAVVFAIPTARGFMAGSITDDVTVQKQAELELRERETFLNAIIETLMSSTV